MFSSRPPCSDYALVEVCYSCIQDFENSYGYTSQRQRATAYFLTCFFTSALKSSLPSRTPAAVSKAHQSNPPRGQWRVTPLTWLAFCPAMSAVSFDLAVADPALRVSVSPCLTARYRTYRLFGGLGDLLALLDRGRNAPADRLADLVCDFCCAAAACPEHQMCSRRVQAALVAYLECLWSSR